jgi:predicted nucleic acid-binding Zn ribbon protein
VYKFVDTGETFEVQQAFTDDALTEAPHPQTGEVKPVKKVFTPVGVTFKGGGFYKTDSRGKSSSTSPSTGGADSTSGDSKGSPNGSSGDTKSESKSDGTSSSSDSSGSSSKPAPAASSSGSSGSGSTGSSSSS